MWRSSTLASWKFSSRRRLRDTYSPDLWPQVPPSFDYIRYSPYTSSTPFRPISFLASSATWTSCLNLMDASLCRCPPASPASRLRLSRELVAPRQMANSVSPTRLHLQPSMKTLRSFSSALSPEMRLLSFYSSQRRTRSVLGCRRASYCRYHTTCVSLPCRDSCAVYNCIITRFQFP